jgi:O-6-methylguanine DNA methyltransferase
MQLYNSHSSPFDRLVWETLLSIPYGQTLSYLDIAKAIGQTKAVRAVGGACGRNPMPLLIPCHRVIRSDGGLGGFSAGSTSGIEIKKRLLAFEAA